MELNGTTAITCLQQLMANSIRLNFWQCGLSLIVVLFICTSPWPGLKPNCCCCCCNSSSKYMKVSYTFNIKCRSCPRGHNQESTSKVGRWLGEWIKVLDSKSLRWFFHQYAEILKQGKNNQPKKWRQAAEMGGKNQ